MARTNSLKVINSVTVAEELPGEWLTQFEEKVVDDLALALIDPESDLGAIEDQAETAAKLLGCTPLQAAIAGAQTARAVLTVTPRREGYYGAAEGDLYFDLGFAREQLKASRSFASGPRPITWARF